MLTRAFVKRLDRIRSWTLLFARTKFRLQKYARWNYNFTSNSFRVAGFFCAQCSFRRYEIEERRLFFQYLICDIINRWRFSSRRINEKNIYYRLSRRVHANGRNCREVQTCCEGLLICARRRYTPQVKSKNSNKNEKCSETKLKPFCRWIFFKYVLQNLHNKKKHYFIQFI